MKQFSTRFFVMVAALLVCGFSQWHASTNRVHSVSPALEQLEQAILGPEHADNVKLVYLPASTGSTSGVPRIEITEVREKEEDEKDEQDATLVKGSFIDLFYARYNDSFLSFSDIDLPSEGGIPSALSSRYLILQVLRI